MKNRLSASDLMFSLRLKLLSDLRSCPAVTYLSWYLLHAVLYTLLDVAGHNGAHLLLLLSQKCAVKCGKKTKKGVFMEPGVSERGRGEGGGGAKGQHGGGGGGCWPDRGFGPAGPPQLRHLPRLRLLFHNNTYC